MLITGLFYPALLGAWIYEAFDHVYGAWSNNYTLDLMQLFIAGVLLIHFIFDYMYTLGEGEDGYGNAQFMLDLVLVVSVYVCLKLAISPQYYDLLWVIWLALAFVKALAILWEHLRANTFGMIIDAAFFVAYLLGAIFVAEISWIFIAVCAIDSVFYEIYEQDKRRNA
jgi:hypothetical protein